MAFPALPATRAVQQAAAALAVGRMVVVVDDADREDGSSKLSPRIQSGRCPRDHFAPVPGRFPPDSGRGRHVPTWRAALLYRQRSVGGG